MALLGPSILSTAPTLPSSKLLGGGCVFHIPGEKSLRGAAFPPLQAGWDALGRAVCFPSLLFSFLRLINMAIQLLQDEEREVRHEASGFASLLQQSPGEPLRDGCIFVQDNVGLQSLLQLLLGEFREHPETFNSLLQHIPILDLRSIVEELEANK